MAKDKSKSKRNKDEATSEAMGVGEDAIMAETSAEASSSTVPPDVPETESPSSPVPTTKSKKRKRKAEDDGPVEEPDTSPAADDDTPALSHAELRRQKKKLAKLAASESATPISSPSKTPSKKRDSSKDTSTPTQAQRQHSIWVGNLSFRTTEDALREFFAAAGEVTRVNMPLKPAAAGENAGKWKSTRENKGYAYVDFSNASSKTVAITMSEGHLDGRRLLIKDGDDFAGRPALQASAERPEGTTNTKFAKRILASQKQPPAPTLFLGNLSFETTESSIREMFDAHRRPTRPTSKPTADTPAPPPAATSDDDSDDEDDDGKPKATEAKPKPTLKEKGDWIRKVRMGTFEDSGLCKGWAFVDFHTTAAATAALTNPHNYSLDGRDIKVEYASADAVRRGGGVMERKVGDTKGDGKVGERTGNGRHKVGVLGKGKYDKETRRLAKEGKLEPRLEVAKLRKEEAPVDVLPVEDRAERRPAKIEQRRGKDGRMRPAPGAALAMAKRESVAIVPSQGTKIKF